MTTWVILRAAGIGAYLMVFLSVVWGLVSTTGALGRTISKASATTIHQFVATCGLFLLAIHLSGLLVDSFMPFGVADVLVPGLELVPTGCDRVRRDRDVRDDVRDCYVMDAQEDRHEVVASLTPGGRADLRPVDGPRRFRGIGQHPALDVVDLRRDGSDRCIPRRRARAHGRLPPRPRRALTFAPVGLDRTVYSDGKPGPQPSVRIRSVSSRILTSPPGGGGGPFVPPARMGVLGLEIPWSSGATKGQPTTRVGRRSGPRREW